MTMYSMTNVTRPKTDPDAIDSIADAYSTLAAGSRGAHSTTSSAVGAVLEENDGPAAGAFRAATTGTGSVQDHLDSLSYEPRPIEVGARQAGREFVNDLTLEELLEYQ